MTKKTEVPMQNLKSLLKIAIRAIGTRCLALTLGSVGGVMFWSISLLGLIKIRGYWKLWCEVYKGNHIIAANHPTLLETFLIPCMFWPWGVLWPSRFFVWSMPDVRLFPKWCQWLYEFGHCIPVDRMSRTGNSQAVRAAQRKLEEGKTLCVHPEGGRTSSPNRGNREGETDLLTNGERRLRPVGKVIIRVAANTSARISPLWVEIPGAKVNNNFWNVIRAWLTKRKSILFFVGDAYSVSLEKNDLDYEQGRLAQAILKAGLSV